MPFNDISNFILFNTIYIYSYIYTIKITIKFINMILIGGKLIKLIAYKKDLKFRNLVYKFDLNFIIQDYSNNTSDLKSNRLKPIKSYERICKITGTLNVCLITPRTQTKLDEMLNANHFQKFFSIK